MKKLGKKQRKRLILVVGFEISYVLKGINAKVWSGSIVKDAIYHSKHRLDGLVAWIAAKK